MLLMLYLQVAFKIRLVYEFYTAYLTFIDLWFFLTFLHIITFASFDF